LAGDYDKFKSQNAQVLAISVDPPGKSRDMSAKLGLPFPLLSDPDHKVIESFGVLDGNMAQPSTFVLDTAGVIRWSYLGDRTDRPFNDTIVSSLGDIK
jgi:peroxiredoxin Q/BCP